MRAKTPVEQAILLQDNPPPPAWVGGSEAKKKVCVPKIGLKISGPFEKFHLLPEENFSDFGGGGGSAEAGQPPPPPGAP